MISGSKVIHIENGNKIKLGKGVEVSEQTFENNRKNVIKQKNQEMFRIVVEIDLPIHYQCFYPDLETKS